MNELSEPTVLVRILEFAGATLMISGTINALVMAWRSSTAKKVQGWLREQRKRNRGK